jgi:hypothetical protein
VLVWVQPRRSIEPMLATTVRALHGGKPVLLAAQHFQILPQQFRGGDFEPQLLAAARDARRRAALLPRALDRARARGAVRRALRPRARPRRSSPAAGARRDFERQASALPFQIRVPSASANPRRP